MPRQALPRALIGGAIMYQYGPLVFASLDAGRAAVDLLSPLLRSAIQFWDDHYRILYLGIDASGQKPLLPRTVTLTRWSLSVATWCSLTRAARRASASSQPTCCFRQ